MKISEGKIRVRSLSEVCERVCKKLREEVQAIKKKLFSLKIGKFS